jgi:peptidoglycan/LPS O-acetylase OafA/YrhL
MRHYARPWSATAYHGVTVFFVLSGYLITSKLLEGPINFKRFYLRRFFRLMPAAWVFLIVVLLFSQLTGLPFTSIAEVKACVFFYRNYLGMMGVAGHFWSLSVEEQFYLAWPVTLLLAGRHRCQWIALVGAVGCAAFRSLFWTRFAPNFPAGPTMLHGDGLLVGCLMAILFTNPSLRPHLVRWSRFCAIPALCTLLTCMYMQRPQLLLVEQFSIACLIASTTFHSASFFLRPFSFRPLTWLGTVSYSVYIW